MKMIIAGLQVDLMYLHQKMIRIYADTVQTFGGQYIYIYIYIIKMFSGNFIQMKGIRRQKASSHTNSLLLIQNCMLQRLYSINIYSLQNMVFGNHFK